MQPVEYNQRAEEAAHYQGHDDDFVSRHYNPPVNGIWTAEDQAKYIAWRAAQNESLSLCDESESEEVDLSFLLGKVA